MPYPVPTSLSPSRVESFLSCPLAFRFASVERLPEPPSVHLTKGSFVHRVLEVLFTHTPDERHREAVATSFDIARAEYEVHPDLVDLGLDHTATEQFFSDSQALVERYLAMEDPRHVRDIGLELRLEAPLGGLTVRGVIDRLELDEHGELIISDYKTGRAPGPQYREAKMTGVHVYSYLCETLFGRRPAQVRLLYLRSGEVVSATPSDVSTRAVTQRVTAVWNAIARACETGDFRPRQSPLCSGCSFRTWCPVFGGDPELAAVEAPAAHRRSAA